MVVETKRRPSSRKNYLSRMFRGFELLTNHVQWKIFFVGPMLFHVERGLNMV